MQEQSTANCFGCGTLKRPLVRSAFCTSRCRVLSARRGVFLSTDSGRFDAKIESVGACRLFRGDLNHAGYGTFYVGVYGIRAHVFAWIRKHGPVPDGLEVCHTCHVRACTEDAHLYLDTHPGNMALSVRDGRMASVLTEDIVKDARRRILSGEWREDLATEYRVPLRTLASAINGQSWGHITDPAPVKGTMGGARYKHVRPPSPAEVSV